MPASSFSEYALEPNPVTKKKDVVWFALNDERPLFAFAGLWTTYQGDRGTKAKPKGSARTAVIVGVVVVFVVGAGAVWFALKTGISKSSLARLISKIESRDES